MSSLVYTYIGSEDSGPELGIYAPYQNRLGATLIAAHLGAARPVVDPDPLNRPSVELKPAHVMKSGDLITVEEGGWLHDLLRTCKAQFRELSYNELQDHDGDLKLKQGGRTISLGA